MPAIHQLILYRGLNNEEPIRLIKKLMSTLTLTEEEIVDLRNEFLLQLLSLATTYGFDENLWQCYLVYLVMMDENPFSLSCERFWGPEPGSSILDYVESDFALLYAMFHQPFEGLDPETKRILSPLISYRARTKPANLYHKEVGSLVKELRLACLEAKDSHDFMAKFVDHYRGEGVGVFGLNRVFIYEAGDFKPVYNLSYQSMDQLIGYDLQKRQLLSNTEAFVRGLPANNVLLYGDSGTGKSTSIKALSLAFYKQGLRIIEVKKTQLKDLTPIINRLKGRNYPFILYMDDLSFEEFEVEYKYLKAVIEGGISALPKHVVLYATSNRRHFVKELWDDRKDMNAYEVHRSDTMQEKLSLVDRFGLTINYTKPDQNAFYDIVKGIAKDYPDLPYDEEALMSLARQWELRYHGLSGRSARQFIDDLLGKEGLKRMYKE